MKILLNILTHGDERIGIKVAREVKKLNIQKGTLFVQLANEKAYKMKRRFVDQDLNRSFPGKKKGNYEERRARVLLTSIKSADLVIDIHSTKSELKDSIIVTKLDQKTLQYVQVIRPRHVLVMKITSRRALVSQAKVGLAFEYGKDNDSQVLRNILRDIKRLFSYIGILDVPIQKSQQATKYFSVFAVVKKPKKYILLPKIKNFRRVQSGEAYATNGQERLLADWSFYPILFGNSNYETIFGFAAKRIYPVTR
jgi:succinylglutamate desuccinylase